MDTYEFQYNDGGNFDSENVLMKYSVHICHRKDLLMQVNLS